MHLFDPASKIMQALTFLADLLLLSIYFVVTSLPVVTIGAVNRKPATVSWLMLIFGFQFYLSSLLMETLLLRWNKNKAFSFSKKRAFSAKVCYNAFYQFLH